MCNRLKSLLNHGLTITIFFFSAGLIEAAPAPAKKQAPMIVRVLAFDKNLKTRVKKDVKVIVLAKPDDMASQKFAKSMVSALLLMSKKTTIRGLRLNAIPMTYKNEETLASKLKSLTCAAIYICNGFSDEILSKILKLTRQESVLSMSGNEAFVKAGVSIGLVFRGGRPLVYANVSAAKAEGAILSPALLRFAKVIK